ncbi:carboxypeptidase-like regulatory domain-containing protein [Cystobacter fuscus]|uniref:carboxypeptidase-like regulatory domain-containing protein n=1 Tax=Cystobacter fuscus TaxID=43 RepID=UPI0002AE4CED|nr:carboxypeptidase-like regulatory domain-containing protein [Cystobacter fuscus]
MWMVLGLAHLSACDGGLRVPNPERDPCTEELVTLRVEVVDAQGGLVGGAVVTATHTDTGHSVTSTTSERGVTTAVNEDIGPGRVRLTALAGTRPSDSAEVVWTCDECHCHPEPSSVQLHLRP